MTQPPWLLPSWLTPERLSFGWSVAVTIAALAFGLMAAQWSWRMLGRLLRDRASAQLVMLAQRAAWWGLVGLAVSTALRAFGVDLSLFLGAAGIVTVSVGFASQTAASNLISGLFLVGERPFVVGDVIEVGGTTGEVVAIDLLSVKLRTFDNRLVRLPNETLIKAQVVNLTHFPIRRVDLVFLVPHDTDPDLVRDVAIRTADDTEGILEEPRPLVFFESFTLDGVQFSVTGWATQREWYDTRNRLARDLLVAFKAAGLRLAVPVRSLQEPRA